jgi:hypothetical protein
MDGNSWWYLSRFSGQANARAHRHQDGSTFDGQWLRERVAQLNTIFISGGEAPLLDG